MRNLALIWLPYAAIKNPKPLSATMHVLNTLRIKLLYLVKKNPKSKNHLFFETFSIIPLLENIHLSHNFTNLRNTSGLIVRYINIRCKSAICIVIFRHKNNVFVVFLLIIQENIRDFIKYTTTSL